MDVGQRLDALESRMMVVERALKITPPADQVTLAPPASNWQEDRVAAIEEQLSKLEEDMGEISATAGKIRDLSGKKGKK
jgi:hypothetical protein